MAQGADEMDEELQRSIRERAFALWENDGCPEGRELDYWLQAERELAGQRAAEGHPLAARDDNPLSRSFQEAVLETEQLPSGAAENPLSERVREAAKNQKPNAARSTLKGGDKVEP
jgi:hypothetical protein